MRKSIKKEAAEAGVSMNEYIVLAVEEKLGKNPPEERQGATQEALTFNAPASRVCKI